MTRRERAAVVELLDKRLPERFWAKVIPEPNSSCWIWCGAMSPQRPVYWERDHNESATRAVLSASGIVVSESECVRMRCGVGCCVNPGHVIVESLSELRTRTNHRPTQQERLDSKLAATPNARGCIEFIGSRNEDGYGVLHTHDGRETKAHRLAWELAKGPVPRGLVVMHSCDNPPCCNIDHLSLGTVGDNNRDRHAKGRTKGLRPGGTAAQRVEDGPGHD